MRIERDCSLAKYTTLRIGGICKNLYFPENTEELLHLCSNKKIPVLGGGSNLLINDKKVFDDCICLRNFEKNRIEIDGNRVTVSSGVRLQKLIAVINENGLGGIEYLYSVPGLVGGAVFMNAGRGRGANQQISDWLISIDVLENGEIKTYSKEECMFDYRTSVFQHKECIIISAVFEFEKIMPEEGKKRQLERMELCKAFQDNRFPNAGTTFCRSNSRIMNWVKKFANKNSKSGIHFSDKSANWLQNRGGGTFEEAVRIIKRVEMLHRLIHKQCKTEYIIWE